MEPSHSPFESEELMTSALDNDRNAVAKNRDINMAECIVTCYWSVGGY